MFSRTSMLCAGVTQAAASIEPAASCVVRIPDGNKHLLRQNLSVIEHDPGGGAAYLDTLSAAMQQSLPREVVKLLAAQKSRRHAKPFLVFDNLPVCRRVVSSPPPQGYFPHLKTDALSEHLATGFALLAGEPYSIRYEGDGIVNNVVPQKARAREHTSQGFDVELAFHTEHPALKHYHGCNLAPNGVVVTGVRSDPQGPLTRITDVGKALAGMRASDVGTLQSPLYCVRSPQRWKACAPDVDVGRSGVPLVFEENGAMQICAAFFPGTITGLTPRAEAALGNFHQALKRHAVSLKLEPGRLIYLNNDRSVHARDRFNASFDQRGNGMRWIQRVLVSHDLSRQHAHLRAVRPRVFELRSP